MTVTSISTKHEAGDTEATAIWLGAAELAKIVRKELKAAFPGQKFSVRSSNYSGGSSIEIRWTDGPTQADVDLVVKYLQRVSFDGMIDLKEYHGAFQYDGEWFKASSWVSTYRSYSETFLSDVAAEAEVEGSKFREGDENWYDSTCYSIKAHADGAAWLVTHSGDWKRDQCIERRVNTLAANTTGA